MKWKIFFALTIFASSDAIALESFWPGQVLTIQEVQKKWGSEKFDVKKFHDGDQRARASMASDLMKRQKEFVGKSNVEIRNMLGKFSGFYFSEGHPTYIIEKAKKRGGDVWQIVFLVDEDRKVTEIIVHKNCCD